MKSIGKVTLTCTLIHLNYSTLELDRFLENGLVIAVKEGVITFLPAGYSKHYVDVLLSAGSIVATVIITPTERTTSSEVRNSLDSAGPMIIATKVRTELLAVKNILTALVVGKTLEDVQVSVRLSDVATTIWNTTLPGTSTWTSTTTTITTTTTTMNLFTTTSTGREIEQSNMEALDDLNAIVQKNLNSTDSQKKEMLKDVAGIAQSRIAALQSEKPGQEIAPEVRCNTVEAYYFQTYLFVLFS